MFESGCIVSVDSTPVICFVFGRRDVADWFEQSAVIEPIDPFQGRVLDVIDDFPRSFPADHPGFIEPVDRFGQRVVVRVAVGADRGDYPYLSKPFAVANREELAFHAGMMNKTDDVLSVRPKSHLRCDRCATSGRRANRRYCARKRL